MILDIENAISARMCEIFREPQIIIIAASEVEDFLKECTAHVRITMYPIIPEDYKMKLEGFKFHGIRLISSEQLEKGEIICL